MRTLKKIIIGCLTVVAICSSGMGVAGVLEEIVVTAQKREQNLQDVGISITALSGNQLQNLGMTNTIEISQQVPGMQVQGFSAAFTTFNLRGISQNNFQDNLEV